MELRDIPFGTTDWATITPTEHPGATGLAGITSATVRSSAQALSSPARSRRTPSPWATPPA